jgi:hypothetical protein
MQGDVGAEGPAGALEDDLALDGPAEIALRGRTDGVGDVAAKAVPNIKMLAAHQKLHARGFQA